MDTNRHQLKKEQATTDDTDSTDYARSALERKSSVGATLLYGVRRPGAAFGKLTTNGHELEKEETTTDYTDSTDYARSALERKSSVGATLLYGVRRPGAAFGKLTTN
jgi:hypothetical protein